MSWNCPDSEPLPCQTPSLRKFRGTVEPTMLPSLVSTPSLMKVPLPVSSWPPGVFSNRPKFITRLLFSRVPSLVMRPTGSMNRSPSLVNFPPGMMLMSPRFSKSTPGPLSALGEPMVMVLPTGLGLGAICCAPTSVGPHNDHTPSAVHQMAVLRARPVFREPVRCMTHPFCKVAVGRSFMGEYRRKCPALHPTSKKTAGTSV